MKYKIAVLSLFTVLTTQAASAHIPTILVDPFFAANQYRVELAGNSVLIEGLDPSGNFQLVEYQLSAGEAQTCAALAASNQKSGKSFDIVGVGAAVNSAPLIVVLDQVTGCK